MDLCEEFTDDKIVKMFRPPRAALFLSPEAAAAVRRITENIDRFCAVRIADVRPTVKKEPFEEWDALTFRLEYLGASTVRWHWRDRWFVCDGVYICAPRNYVCFFIGGRVLHYENCTDGAGFLLWPLRQYRRFRFLLGNGKPDGAIQ